MATGDSDDNGDGATGNGVTGYDKDDDGDGNEDDDDDGSKRRRQRGQWRRHAAFVLRGYDKGVVVKGDGKGDNDGNNDDNNDGDNDGGGQRQQRGVLNTRRRRRIVVCCHRCPWQTRRGDTVRVITQWQCPVAPREALVVLYWALRVALHHHIRMVIEMASESSVFFSLSTRN